MCLSKILLIISTFAIGLTLIISSMKVSKLLNNSKNTDDYIKTKKKIYTIKRILLIISFIILIVGALAGELYKDICF